MAAVFRKKCFYQLTTGFPEDSATREFSYKDDQATELEIMADGWFNNAGPARPVKNDRITIVGSDSTKPLKAYVTEATPDIKVASFDGDSIYAAGYQADNYIQLDGVNDHIDLPTLGGATDDLLDFTKEWSLGITLVGVDAPSSAKKMTLFSRGGVHITLLAQQGSTNWGLYVTSDNDLYNTTKRAQANTWYAPGDFSRILFTYNPTTKYLKYYLGDPSTGSYGQRANLSISQTMIDGQNITGGIKIGAEWTGVGGSNFSGYHWDGGVNNFIASDMVFTGPFLDEYFQDVSGDPDAPSSDSFTTAEYYDDVIAFCKLGEDTYPNVVDTLGNITNGELIGGTEDDFKALDDA